MSLEQEISVLNTRQAPFNEAKKRLEFAYAKIGTPGYDEKTPPHARKFDTSILSQPEKLVKLHDEILPITRRIREHSVVNVGNTLFKIEEERLAIQAKWQKKRQDYDQVVLRLPALEEAAKLGDIRAEDIAGFRVYKANLEKELGIGLTQEPAAVEKKHEAEKEQEEWEKWNTRIEKIGKIDYKIYEAMLPDGLSIDLRESTTSNISIRCMGKLIELQRLDEVIGVVDLDVYLHGRQSTDNSIQNMFSIIYRLNRQLEKINWKIKSEGAVSGTAGHKGSYRLVKIRPEEGEKPEAPTVQPPFQGTLDLIPPVQVVAASPEAQEVEFGEVEPLFDEEAALLAVSIANRRKVKIVFVNGLIADFVVNPETLRQCQLILSTLPEREFNSPEEAREYNLHLRQSTRAKIENIFEEVEKGGDLPKRQKDGGSMDNAADYLLTWAYDQKDRFQGALSQFMFEDIIGISYKAQRAVVEDPVKVWYAPEGMRYTPEGKYPLIPSTDVAVVFEEQQQENLTRIERRILTVTPSRIEAISLFINEPEATLLDFQEILGPAKSGRILTNGQALWAMRGAANLLFYRLNRGVLTDNELKSWNEIKEAVNLIEDRDVLIAFRTSLEKWFKEGQKFTRSEVAVKPETIEEPIQPLTEEEAAIFGAMLLGANNTKFDSVGEGKILLVDDAALGNCSNLVARLFTSNLQFKIDDEKYELARTAALQKLNDLIDGNKFDQVLDCEDCSDDLQNLYIWLFEKGQLSSDLLKFLSLYSPKQLDKEKEIINQALEEYKAFIDNAIVKSEEEKRAARHQPEDKDRQEEIEADQSHVSPKVRKMVKRYQEVRPTVRRYIEDINGMPIDGSISVPFLKTIFPRLDENELRQYRKNKDIKPLRGNDGLHPVISVAETVWLLYMHDHGHQMSKPEKEGLKIIIEEELFKNKGN